MLILFQGSHRELQRFRDFLDDHGVSHDYKLRKEDEGKVIYFIEPHLMTTSLITHINQYMEREGLILEVEMRGERYSLKRDLEEVKKRINEMEKIDPHLLRKTHP